MEWPIRLKAAAAPASDPPSLGGVESREVHATFLRARQLRRKLPRSLHAPMLLLQQDVLQERHNYQENRAPAGPSADVAKDGRNVQRFATRTANPQRI